MLTLVTIHINEMFSRYIGLSKMFELKVYVLRMLSPFEYNKVHDIKEFNQICIQCDIL